MVDGLPFKEIISFRVFSLENILSVGSYSWDGRISIFPNPTSDVLSLSSRYGIRRISIYSIKGKKLNVQLKDNSIDLSSFSIGVYLLRIESNEGISMKRVIKN